MPTFVKQATSPTVKLVDRVWRPYALTRFGELCDMDGIGVFTWRRSCARLVIDGASHCKYDCVTHNLSSFCVGGI